MKTERMMLLVVAIAFGLAFWVYPQLPEQVASHWNAAGEADGFISAFWGAFLFPVLILSIYGLYKAMPHLVIKKSNYKSFEPEFSKFILVMLVFMLYAYVITVWWNLYGGFDIARWILPGIALIFWQSANLISKAKQNWFIGIRTPWTLSSNKVWKKTHQLGAKLFKLLALATVVAMAFPEDSAWVILGGAIAAAIIPTIYSFVLYKQETK